MRATANATGIGQAVRRKEDLRLLTGRGCFGDDIALPGMAHAVIVRSPHAHARLASIDKTAALAAAGVFTVLTGAEYVADGLAPIPHNPGLSAPPDVQARTRGFLPIATTHLPLPVDETRYVGEPVAIIVADSIAAAKDAAELLHICYDPLPAVTRATDALKPAAPQLWEIAPGNLCIDIELGDEAATATAFAGAAHVVKLETWAQRVTGAPMEPRTNVADYDPVTRQYTLYTGSGRGVAKVRLDLAEVLGVPPEQVR
ncbi:MAG TPA: molybdopterin cofactor-binding domain-containing protein, partial [Stellaceae bacterium]|nr:molybdopterin cofactor-binding domain-containing protein [Stellaceae bacterium]